MMLLEKLCMLDKSLRLTPLILADFFQRLNITMKNEVEKKKNLLLVDLLKKHITMLKLVKYQVLLV